MNLAGLRNLLPGISSPLKEYYRMVSVYRKEEIDETAHTVLYSWRYNPKGEFGVLYLSKTPECTYREKLKQVDGNKKNIKPQVAGRFNVKLSRCLDLTNPKNREYLGLLIEDIINPTDFSVTQSIAREARHVGFEAIIAPSAIGEDCYNIVIFKDKLLPPSYCICDKASIKIYR